MPILLGDFGWALSTLNARQVPICREAWRQDPARSRDALKLIVDDDGQATIVVLGGPLVTPWVPTQEDILANDWRGALDQYPRFGP